MVVQVEEEDTVPLEGRGDVTTREEDLGFLVEKGSVEVEKDFAQPVVGECSISEMHRKTFQETTVRRNRGKDL